MQEPWLAWLLLWIGDGLNYLSGRFWYWSECAQNGHPDGPWEENPIIEDDPE